MIKRNQVFAIQDADTNITASLTHDPSDAVPSFHVVISDPDHDATIVISLDDFRRMAAAVARHTE